MTHSPSILITLFGFLLLIGPLVMVHEFGHYIVARWCGVRSDVFSLGFGKELLGWTDKRGTRWRIAALPLGGYVQFAGDRDAASAPDNAALAAMTPEEQAQTFPGKPLWQRAAIVAAGPVTNLLVAVLIFAAFNLAYGKVTAPPVIASFAAGTPAQAAGLKVGDRVLAVDGRKVDQFTDIAEMVIPYPGQTVSIAIQRDGREMALPVKLMSFTLKDRFGNESHIGRLGIAPEKPVIVAVGPIEALTLSVRQTGGVIRMIGVGIKQIVMGDRSISELGGPIKTAKYSGEQLSMGWLSFVNFAAFISINLAFINLLPIPTLDGGHLAFYAAEAIRRRPAGDRSQDWAYRTGLAFVLAFMLFVTINDLTSLFAFGR
ncbi:MAG: RIP metalloprotease RseP [Novosphingobium sp.]